MHFHCQITRTINCHKTKKPRRTAAFSVGVDFERSKIAGYRRPFKIQPVQIFVQYERIRIDRKMILFGNDTQRVKSADLHIIEPIVAECIRPDPQSVSHRSARKFDDGVPQAASVILFDYSVDRNVSCRRCERLGEDQQIRRIFADVRQSAESRF